MLIGSARLGNSNRAMEYGSGSGLDETLTARAAGGSRDGYDEGAEEEDEEASQP